MGVRCRAARDLVDVHAVLGPDLSQGPGAVPDGGDLGSRSIIPRATPRRHVRTERAAVLPAAQGRASSSLLT